MSYFKENIERMEAYVPGEQPSDTLSVVKLNTNENPYPPSPKVQNVLANVPLETLRVYPDPAGRSFTKVVSEVLDVPADWIVAGNGSDNILVMIARACGGPVVVPTPTFPFYESQADVEGVEFIEVDTDENFGLPLEGLKQANGAVTFVANPNSPTGAAASIEQLDELATALDGVLVIDEAYADFTEIHALDLVRKHENVIVTRTLSKGYSLAGLRLGFAVAQPQLIKGLWKTKEIYNVGSITLAVGAAAFSDQDHKNANAAKIRVSREKLAADLKELGWVVWPSETNFLLTGPADGDAQAVEQYLKQQGMYVRYFKHPRLQGLLRITVGTEQQNARLIELLRQQNR